MQKVKRPTEGKSQSNLPLQQEYVCSFISGRKVTIDE